MRTAKLALLVLCGVTAIPAVSFAQFSGLPTPPPPTNTVPITITGRIVKENGDPLVGIRMMPALQTESTPMMPPLPVTKPFRSVPSKCFHQPNNTPATTDGNGRYTYTVQFVPDATINIRGDKCSTLRNQLTRENVSLMADLSQPEVHQYEFRVATGPLPSKMPTVNTNVDIAPQKAPGGFVPQLKK